MQALTQLHYYRITDARTVARERDRTVVLDLCLPDSQGIAAFEQVRRAAPHVPILVIGSPDDEDVATQAVELGAQDYLRRDRLDSYTLPRVLKRIIERQAAEEALFFEQQRANVTLNSIGDAVLSTDVPGNVTYLNPVAERMTGWPRQEALGRPLVEVFQIIDATTREPARKPMDQAIQLNRIVGLTPNCLLVRRDGLETAIEDSASPIHDRAGQVIGAVIVFHDVSALRALSLQRGQTQPWPEWRACRTRAFGLSDVSDPFVLRMGVGYSSDHLLHRRSPTPGGT